MFFEHKVIASQYYHEDSVVAGEDASVVLGPCIFLVYHSRFLFAVSSFDMQRA